MHKYHRWRSMLSTFLFAPLCWETDLPDYQTSLYVISCQCNSIIMGVRRVADFFPGEDKTFQGGPNILFWPARGAGGLGQGPPLALPCGRPWLSMLCLILLILVHHCFCFTWDLGLHQGLRQVGGSTNRHPTTSLLHPHSVATPLFDKIMTILWQKNPKWHWKTVER